MFCASLPGRALSEQVEGYHHSMVTIRPAVVSDIDSVSKIARRAYQGYTARIGRPAAPMNADYPDQVSQGLVSVAEIDDEVVGFIVLLNKGDHLLLENVAVSHRAQGKGIGGRLLAFAEEEATRQGCAEIRLYTNEAMVENLEYYPAGDTSRPTGANRMGIVAFSSRSRFGPDSDLTLASATANPYKTSAAVQSTIEA
jgi:predicted N-acetyltransferase YhbS